MWRWTNGAGVPCGRCMVKHDDVWTFHDDVCRRVDVPWNVLTLMYVCRRVDVAWNILTLLYVGRRVDVAWNVPTRYVGLI